MSSYIFSLDIPYDTVSGLSEYCSLLDTERDNEMKCISASKSKLKAIKAARKSAKLVFDDVSQVSQDALHSANLVDDVSTLFNRLINNEQVELANISKARYRLKAISKAKNRVLVLLKSLYAKAFSVSAFNHEIGEFEMNFFEIPDCDFESRMNDELDRIDRIISERRAAILSADAAKSRAWRILRHAKMNVANREFSHD